MIWDQSKDAFCYLCLAGSVVTSYSFIQEVVDSNNLLIVNISVTDFADIYK